MSKAIEGIGYWIVVAAWLGGTVLAPGFWKIAAVFFPPYAWYLVAELLMQRWGLIA